MLKQLSLLFFFLIVTSAFATPTYTGTGTAASPYQIDTCVELQDMNYYLNVTTVYFELSANVDCSDTLNWVKAGGGLKGFSPIGNDETGFRGHFDGNKFAIKSLMIYADVNNNVGLFGYAPGAKIKRLGLVDVNIYSTKEYVGALTGRVSDETDVNNVYVLNGKITGVSYVGGITGENSGDINKCYTKDINIMNNTANHRAGGIAGRSYARIENCYSTAKISSANGTIYAGGISGYQSTGTFVNTYWNTIDSNVTQSFEPYGTIITQAQQKKQASYANWDFTYTWGIVEDLNTPYLLYLEFPVAIDFNLPVTSTNAANFKNWSPTTITVNFSCTDLNSGCKTFGYSVDDINYYKPWVADTNNTVSFSNDGNHGVFYYSSSNLDFNEIPKRIFIAIDKTNPTMDFNVDFNNSGGFFAAKDFNVATVSLNCFDNNSTSIDYNIIIGDKNILSGRYAAGGIKKADFNISGNVNAITLICTDLAGNVIRDINIFKIYLLHFDLIDEQTGVPFNLADANTLYAVNADLNQSYDFKGKNVNTIYYFSNGESSLRFYTTYTGVTDFVTRDFSLSILSADTNVARVCIPKIQTFYAQYLTSNTVKAAIVKNPLTDCYLMADYVKYAYQTSLLTPLYTINMQYYLYTITNNQKTLLAQLDGSISSQISIDMLEFGSTTYDLTIAGDGISISKAYDNTLKFYYLNLREDNEQINFKLYDPDDALIWNYTETATPNELTVYFDHTTLDLNAGLFRLVIVKTKTDGSTETFTKEFTLEGYTGVLSPVLAVIIAFVILIFSLTFVAYRYAMGWFGIIAGMIAIGVLTFAPPVWYVTFSQAIIAIIIVFIVLIYKNETVGVT